VSDSKISLGTCAWAYDDWRGVFYPETIPAAQRLGWYARYFRAVEVDSTFYHPPSPRSTAQWLESTPDGFLFTTKLSRAITHERRLRESGGLLREFLNGLEPLRSKLGCVLIQLPAFFKPAQDEEALRRFIAQLPRDWPFAVEFRDTAWRLPRVVHWLQERGVCWAWTDTEPYSHQAEGAFEWLPITADFLYIRLLGDLSTKFDANGKRRIARYDRIFWPRSRAIENWAVKVRHHLAESRRIFLFAANHFEGISPLTCGRLARALGLELELPKLEGGPSAPPEGRQLDLF